MTASTAAASQVSRPEIDADRLAAEAVAAGLAAGLAACAIASAKPLDEARVALEERKAAGLSGGMNFTYRNPARSSDPRRILPGAAALVVGAWPYRAREPERPDGPTGRVARYAWADHYRDLCGALDASAGVLRSAGYAARVVADDNALVDRAVAHRAGIGWFGKNANILVRGHGSWVVLGAVVTDAPLPASDKPMADACGACRRCIDGCPTQAIVAPGVVDARRCLAWLVQAPGAIPVEYRVALGDRIYGCDDCQEVCPPNRRAAQPVIGGSGGVSGTPEQPPNAWVDLLELLAADDATLLERYGRWYIAGRDPRHLRRNALVALGNIADPRDPTVVAAIDSFISAGDELLAEHAMWARGRLAERAAGPAA